MQKEYDMNINTNNANLISEPKNSWLSRWLRLPISPEGANSFAKVRKDVTIDSAFEQARICITADTFYKLWINGEQVGSGPARSNPSWYTYDMYDLTDLLQEGVNQIAVLVNSPFEGRAAFLGELDLKNDDTWKTVATSDTSWFVRTADEYSSKTKLFSMWEYSEDYDMRKYDPEWLTAAPEEPLWTPAVLLEQKGDWVGSYVPDTTVERRMPAAMPYARVLPRDIPQLEYEELSPASIQGMGEVLLWDFAENAERPEPVDPSIEMANEQLFPLEHCSITEAQGLLGPQRACCVLSTPSPELCVDDYQGSYEPYLTLDFGRLVNAHLVIEIETDDPAILDIGYADRLIGDRPLLTPYANRCQADRVRLSGGTVRWESFSWHLFRYVHLRLRSFSGSARIHIVHARSSEYPLRTLGKFTSSSASLDRIWTMADRTLRLCVNDNIMDNSLREKNGWSADIPSAVHSYCTFYGDTDMIQHYFRTLCRGQESTGLIPPFAPSSIGLSPVDAEGNSIIVDGPLSLIVHLSEYCRYGAHPELASELLPYFLSFYDLLESYLSVDGALVDVPGVYFVDWANIDKRGTLFIINAWYREGLLFLAERCEEPGRRDLYLERSEKIREILRNEFWSEERGLFADSTFAGEKSTRFSEHTNYSAILYGIATEEQEAPILEHLLHDPEETLVRVEPSFMYYVLDALFAKDLAKEALGLIERRYERFIGLGMDTLGEEWNPFGTFRVQRWMPRIRSLAQASAATFPYTIAKGLFGIRAVSTGFTEYTIRPQLSAIEQASITYPSPAGLIEVSWTEHEGRRALTIVCPPASVGTLILDAKWSILEMDGAGTLIDGPDDRQSYVRLPVGSSHFEIGLDPR